MAKRTNGTYAIALGGILAALSVALMFFSAFIPVGKLVLPAAAGILLICAVCELGEGLAFLIFAVVGLLSLLLPDKAGAVFYIFFLGHYPIVKSYLERIRNRVLNWVLKLLVFNLCAAAAFFITVYLLGITYGLFRYSFGIIPVWLALNAAFVVYDIAVSGVAKLYVARIGKLLHRR
jgi:hypothetical protein